MSIVKQHIDRMPTAKVGRFGKCVNVPFSFDTETSSFYDGEKKVALVYIWMFGFANIVTYGRSIFEFRTFINRLNEILDKCHVTPKAVVWVHNLPYDFAFIKKLFHFDKVFCIDSRKPVYAKTGNIIFRDSLIMSGGRSLALIGKELRNHVVRKMVGDLDYRLIRTPETPLTDKELGYCMNDIRVLNAYIYEKIDQDGTMGGIPMTNTGYVRRDLRNSCMEHKKQYMGMMDELTITPDCYAALRAAQMGGFTHAARRHVGRVIHNVGSFDIRSSYPTVMLLEQYPMGMGMITSDEYAKCHVTLICEKYCAVFRCVFHNLGPRLGWEFPISISKCNPRTLECATVTNGRVMTAALLETWVTNVDWQIYSRFYVWEDVEISNCYIFKKDYLPREIAKQVVGYFWKKTALKGVEGEEREYMISKNMLNAVYGCACMNPVRDEYGYDNELDFLKNGAPINGDEKRRVNVTEAVEKYNDDPNRFLFYPWGVWVTAYARRNLFEMIERVGPDYIYSDTDSVKLMNWEQHWMEFMNYNARVLDKIEASAKHYRFDEEQYKPRSPSGKKQILGTFEFEAVYERFKTLGAKRYLCELRTKGKPYNRYSMTVAGLNKRRGCEFLCGYECHVTPVDPEVIGTHTATRDPFDVFNDGMVVPADKSGRLIMTYIDERREGDVVDYLGNKYHYVSPSGIHAEPSEYHLGVDDDLRGLLDMVAMVIGDSKEEENE